MNIKYHAACGLVLDVVFKTNGMCTLFSVLPDTPLLVNEYKLWKEKKKFNAEEVNDLVFSIYMIKHSLFMCALVFYITDEILGFAYLLHIIADWFTHTGRFTAMPLYPFITYKFPLGREILK